MRGAGVVGLLVALAASTIACGQGEPVAAERTSLTVAMADDWAGTAAVLDAVRDFEFANPGVRVHIQDFGFSQVPDAVAASLESDEPFDVAHFHAFAAAARGMAEPVDDLWEAHLDPASFFPGALDTVRWDGRLYGVPLDVNALLLFTNDDLLRDAGVDPDGLDTFAAMATAAQAVTTPDGERRGISIAHSNWAAYGWIRANGGEIVAVDADGQAQVTLDDPRVVEALDFLGGLIHDGVAFPPIARGAIRDAFTLFREEVTGLHVTGTWDLATLEADPPGWGLSVHPMPQNGPETTAGTVLGGSSLFIPTGSENRELAFELMVHLLDDAYALRYATEGGRMPSRPRVFDDPFFATPAMRTLAAQLEVATPMRLIAFPQADDAFTRALEAILTGQDDAAVALGRAQQEAERALRTVP